MAAPNQYDLIIKQGDLEATLVWTLADASGPVLIPAGSTALFRMTRMGQYAIVGGGACQISNQLVTPGQIAYTWQTADLANTGSYWAEFEITYPDGKTRTFPNNRQLAIQVVRELG
jgi:hypothetical protein